LGAFPFHSRPTMVVCRALLLYHCLTRSKRRHPSKEGKTLVTLGLKSKKPPLGDQKSSIQPFEKQGNNKIIPTFKIDLSLVC